MKKTHLFAHIKENIIEDNDKDGNKELSEERKMEIVKVVLIY